MSASVYGKGLFGLLKRGWNEIPEVMGSSVLAVVGIGLCYTGYFIYKSKDGDNKRYKLEYIVVRPDDPRAKNLKD